MMIEAHGLGRRYGPVEALAGVSLEVATGSVMGLLGHNGAGKTTLVQLLTTLVPPTSGNGRVAGYDIERQGHDVRRRIGLTGQFASLDERLSGTENLVLVARLLGADRPGARRRAAELLEIFQLQEAAHRPVAQYSGGMRRRLDIAASMVGQPAVLFLDEPTTGLDPLGRAETWHVVRELVRFGTTILLTTQDLEEADRLADRITVLAGGRTVAAGTPRELKRQVGTRAVVVVPRDIPNTPAVIATLASAGFRPEIDIFRGAVVAPAADGQDLVRAVVALGRHGVEVSSIALAEPTLHDVYLSVAAGRPPVAPALPAPPTGRRGWTPRRVRELLASGRGRFGAGQ